MVENATKWKPVVRGCAYFRGCNFATQNSTHVNAHVQFEGVQCAMGILHEPRWGATETKQMKLMSMKLAVMHPYPANGVLVQPSYKKHWRAGGAITLT